jgi:hypothetical protein
VASFLPGCPVLDDVVLCTSEVVTNALRYSRSRLPGGRVTVQVEVTAGAARIDVADQGAAMPAASAHGIGAGWQIIRELADEYGRDGTRAWFAVCWATNATPGSEAALFDDDPFSRPDTVIVCHRIRRKSRTS